MTEILKIVDLVVGYGAKPVASIPDFSMDPSRITVVTGPNGSGKTTILKTLAGLLPPVRGRVVPRLPAGHDGVVFVHSTPFLFAGTVQHNMQITSRSDHQRARDSMRSLGVEHLWNQDVRRLSTGQRQRVALARAVAAGPRLLLIDEPEGGLDAEGSSTWRRMVERMLSDRHPSIVVATHHLSVLEDLPLTVVRLDRCGSQQD